MTANKVIQDDALATALANLTTADSDRWSYRANVGRKLSHAYFQYPAMMVPSVQRDLIEAVRNTLPCIRQVLDPFVGSGTTLTESMFHGLDFIGTDINPLAILLCRAKQGPFQPCAFREQFRDLQANIDKDTKSTYEATFRGLTKWFQKPVIIRLSRIRRAIRALPLLHVRRFFWVALAETVRLTSNSRTSTFKLHIRPDSELTVSRGCPHAIFKEIVDRNIAHMEDQYTILKEGQRLRRGYYVGNTAVEMHDVRHERGSTGPKCDLLVTSPPYGDNVSTVPYGQHSFLPLQWIDAADIDSGITPDYLRTTHEIDSRSLGGSRVDAASAVHTLSDLSPSFQKVAKALGKQPADRLSRVASFCRDLNHCIAPTLSRLRKHAYMIWTVGNRKVGGHPIPLDAILTDLLVHHGSKQVLTISRRILSKRMAVRNSVSSTMRTEKILIFRKDAN